MKRIVFLLALKSVFILPLYKAKVTQLKPLMPQTAYVVSSQGLFKPTSINLASNNNWWDKPNNQDSDNWWNKKDYKLSDTYNNYDQLIDKDYWQNLKYQGFKIAAGKGSQAYVYMHPKFKKVKRNIEDVSEDIYKIIYPKEKKQPETIREHILDFWENTAKERTRKLEDINDFLKYKLITVDAKIRPELYKIDMILNDLAEQILLQRKLYNEIPYTDEDRMNIKLFLWAVVISGVTGTAFGLTHDVYSLIHEYFLAKDRALIYNR